MMLQTQKSECISKVTASLIGEAWLNYNQATNDSKFKYFHKVYMELS